MADRLTSFAWALQSPSKEDKTVLEIVEEGVKFFAKLFRLKQSSIHLYTDGGPEFERLKDKFHHITVLVGSKVEQKNSHLQRNFHRIKNSKRGNTIKNVLQQALNTTNNSYNRILKKTPAEAAEEFSTPEGIRKLKESYNKHRAKGDLDRRKPLKVGDFVRIVVKKTLKDQFRKAYRGLTFTKEGWPVNKSNINKGFAKKLGWGISKEAYEILETKGNNPKQYKIMGVYKDPKKIAWFSRHMLSEPLPNKGRPDQISEDLLKSRTQSGHKKGSEKHKKFAKKQKESGDKVKKAFGSFDIASVALDKADAKLDKYIFRETVTQKKFDDLMLEFNKILGYFVWHATHGSKLVSTVEEARTYRDLLKDSIKELKKIRIV